MFSAERWGRGLPDRNGHPSTPPRPTESLNIDADHSGPHFIVLATERQADATLAFVMVSNINLSATRLTYRSRQRYGMLATASFRIRSCSSSKGQNWMCRHRESCSTPTTSTLAHTYDSNKKERKTEYRVEGYKE